MKKLLRMAIIMLAFVVALTGCKSNKSKTDNKKTIDNKSTTQNEELKNQGFPREESFVVEGDLAKTAKYYNDAVKIDSDCVNYIKECKMYDKQINDNFVIHLSLPPDYDKNKQYPAIFMTDGVWRLTDHPELRKMMKDGEIKPVILVDIGYPDDYDFDEIRKRDLIYHPDDFLHFIVDDVVPYIEKKYSVDKSDLTLTGHSLGGYWGYYALFNSDTIGKHTFKNYYIGSPTIFKIENVKYIYDCEKEYYSRNKTLDCNIYVSVGGNEYVSQYINTNNDFIDFLKKRNYKSLNIKYEIIDGYDHNHVFKPSIKNTVKLFYGLK